MKVLLVQPPGGSITQPYVSTPSLVAQLREHGVEAHQVDLGIPILDGMLESDTLGNMLKKIQSKFEILDSKAELDGKEQKQYMALHQALRTSRHAVENIDGSKELLRGNGDYLDYGKYFHAVKSVQAGLKIISAAYHPSKVSYHGHVAYDALASPEALMEALNNGSTNIFREGLWKFVSHNMADQGYDVVGISISFEQQIVPALTLAAILKETLPDIKVVLGGATVTKLARRGENVRENSFMAREIFELFDFMITYEGETPLLKLIEALDGKGDIADVPSLTYLDNASSQIVRHELAPPEDINLLPTPTYDGLPMELYLSPELEILLPVSRGCYWGRCAFCDVSAATSKKFRARNPELVVQDMAALMEETGSRYFYFSVDIAAPNHLKKISEEIVKAGMDIRWTSQVRFESGFDLETLKGLERAGCWQLIFGLESANERVLEHMDKGIKPSEVRKILDASHEAGVVNAVQFFVGFPSETEEEALDTVKFLKDNSKLVDSMQFSGVFLLGGGSRVFEELEDFGVALLDEGSNRIRCEHLYSVKQGMSMLDASDMATRVLKEIHSARKDHAVFMELGTVPPLHLYVEKYSRDYFRELADEHAASKTKAFKAISAKKAFVVINKDLMETELNYNLNDIRNNLSQSKQENMLAFIAGKPREQLPGPVFPEKSQYTCNTVTGDLFRDLKADPDIKIIMELCETPTDTNLIEEHFKEAGKKWANGVIKLMSLYDMGVLLLVEN